jgi:hypothetical protein
VVEELYAAGPGEFGMPRKELREATVALLDCPPVMVGASANNGIGSPFGTV